MPGEETGGDRGGGIFLTLDEDGCLLGSGDSLACGEFVRGTTKEGDSGMVFEGGTCISAEGRIREQSIKVCFITFETY